jgi:hypothetical protein
MIQLLTRKSILLLMALTLGVVAGCKKVTEEEVCLASAELSTKSITGTSAELSWAAAADAVQYVVQYRKAGVSGFTEAGRPKTNSFILTGLSKGTDYEWKVQSNCPGANSTFSDVAVFKTKSVNEVIVERKWKIQEWKTNGVALTLSAGDFADFKTDGVYSQQLIGVNATGTWQFTNAAQTNLKINAGSENEWKLYEISESSIKMTRISPAPADSVILLPF